MRPIAQFVALADDTRCRILELLNEKPLPVHELAAGFDISRPAISRHLRVLKQAGLVREERHGRENVYAFTADELAGAQRWLEAFGSPRTPTPAPVSVRSRHRPTPPPATAPMADLFGFLD